MAIERKLLDILACPRCKGTLTLAPDKKALHCAHCQLAYPVRDNIPILLIEEAMPLEPEKK